MDANRLSAHRKNRRAFMRRWRRIRRNFASGVQAVELMLGVGILVIMTKRGNEFELKLGRIGDERSSTLTGVRAKVHQHTGAKARPKTRIAPRTGIRAHFRKGSAGRPRPVIPSQRRVVVKARYAMHGSGKGAPLRACELSGARRQSCRARRAGA